MAETGLMVTLLVVGQKKQGNTLQAIQRVVDHHIQVDGRLSVKAKKRKRHWQFE